MAQREQALGNPTPSGLGEKTEAEKTEKRVATAKRVEEDLRSASQ